MVNFISIAYTHKYTSVVAKSVRLFGLDYYKNERDIVLHVLIVQTGSPWFQP